jgi:hypothetical protein
MTDNSTAREGHGWADGNAVKAFDLATVPSGVCRCAIAVASTARWAIAVGLL